MTTYELCAALELNIFSQGEDRQVAGGYCGDLLSWVMSRAPQDSAWITVMNNHNVAAVSVLCDTACIILAENAQPDTELLKRAQSENLCLYGSSQDMFSLAAAIDKML